MYKSSRGNPSAFLFFCGRDRTITDFFKKFFTLSKAFQLLVEKVNLIADYVHEARLEQSTNSDEEWVDSQVVCQYLRFCEKTLQRLRAASKVAYSCVGNKYYYQSAEIKRCLKAHIIKSSDEILDDLIQRSGYNPRR